MEVVVEEEEEAMEIRNNWNRGGVQSDCVRKKTRSLRWACWLLLAGWRAAVGDCVTLLD